MSAIEPHLAVLPVLIALFGAITSAFFRRGASAWLVALVATWLAAGVSWWLLAKVLGMGQPLSYQMGGWAVPWGSSIASMF